MEDNKILPSGKPVSAPLRGRTSPRKRILVVHDDPDLLQLSTSVRMLSGYRVDAAADVAAACEALKTVGYDLLITDFEMPKVSGVELLKKLHAVRKVLPVIVATPGLPKREFPRNPWLQPAVTLLMPYTVEEFLGMVKVVLGAANSTSVSFAPPKRHNWPSPVWLQLW
jgi:DNA-binding NtrC family response regulator